MKTVLLIDDDRDDAELVEQAFQEIDPSVSFRAIEESTEAMDEIIHKKSLSPDLILLDLNLPVLDGWECLRKIRDSEHLRKVPVFIFSTSSRADEKKKAEQCGAAGFITKPSDFKTLVNQMADTIRGI